MATCTSPAPPSRSSRAWPSSSAGTADGQTRWSGYGIDSIADFAHNVNALLRGASLEQLHGRYADGRDARETTRIAVAAHESVRTGKAVDIG